MDRTDLLLAGTLYLPAAVAGVLWFWRPPSARTRAGIVFATIWCAVALVPVQMTAVRFGWWSFTPGAAGLFGMPAELQLGWALFWGMVVALALPRAPLAIVAPLMLLLDAWLMPMLVPAITLGPMWLAGDALAVLVCLVPAQLLFRWTRDDRRLAARAALIAASFVGLMFGILPTVILRETGGSWAMITARPFWTTSLLLQVLAIPAAFGMSAVQEFATRGGGTPVPFDATRRLVTSGPYAFVANPMQLSNSLLLLGAGALLSSWWLAAAGVMSVIYSAGLAAWDERGDLGARFGEPWIEYRRAVRAWIPRWRPYATPGRRAVLYVAEECGKCSEVARWFAARAPVGLEIIAAERHPARDLWRITYDPGDGSAEEEGAAAVGRALEHVNLAWATLGIITRLPVLNSVIQAFVDASGGGPQRIARCATTPEVAA
jgi:protein-S-isoprenylcysteine O-methyltransferase Ste14